MFSGKIGPTQKVKQSFLYQPLAQCGELGIVGVFAQAGDEIGPDFPCSLIRLGVLQNYLQHLGIHCPRVGSTLNPEGAPDPDSWQNRSCQRLLSTTRW